MTRRARLVIAVTAVTLLSSATAFADGWGPGGHYGGGGGFGWRVLHAVGLSDDQKAQIRQIYAAHRQQLQTLGQQIRAAQQELGDKLYSATPPSAADLASMAQERLTVALAIRNVLTPDQLAKAAQIRQQMQQLRQQMRDLTRPTS